MKKDLLLKRISMYLGVLLVLAACSSAPHLKTTTTMMPSGKTISSTEAVGNLEITHALTCMPLESVTPEYTPADLHGAIVDCVKKEDYKNALDLSLISGAYGKFDSLRVTDRTAHQAVIILSMKTSAALSLEEKKKWGEYMKTQVPPMHDLAKCQSIQKFGPPTYYPRYMIQHGMDAVLGDNTDTALVKDFDAADAWKKSLVTYLKCKL